MANANTVRSGAALKRVLGWLMVAGLLLMVYPYFTPSVVSLIAAGGVIGLVLWYLLRIGW